MLFHSLDLLTSSDVVECSASDFVTGYANQSGKFRGLSNMISQALNASPFIINIIELYLGGHVVLPIIIIMVCVRSRPNQQDSQAGICTHGFQISALHLPAAV